MIFYVISFDASSVMPEMPATILISSYGGTESEKEKGYLLLHDSIVGEGVISITFPTSRRMGIFVYMSD